MAICGLPPESRTGSALSLASGFVAVLRGLADFESDRPAADVFAAFADLPDVLPAIVCPPGLG